MPEYGLKRIYEDGTSEIDARFRMSYSEAEWRAADFRKRIETGEGKETGIRDVISVELEPIAPKRYRVTWWTGNRAINSRSAYADTEDIVMILYALINEAMLGDNIDVEEFVEGEYKSTIRSLA